jgi:DNA (cytosine-5)-methyltransferase 1
MSQPVKVIDLFAGPGGLGEGFAAHRDKFKIAISIEKEPSAHKTLLLRAFFRQFKTAPPEYYEFLQGKLGATPDEKLYKIPRFKKQIDAAELEARCLTLGEHNKEIQSAVDTAIGEDDCILIGGPPCQAYSLAGRSRNMGIVDYKAEAAHRHFLYLEYLRVIARYQPKVFVMENVKGMLSAKINGHAIFGQIRADLQNPCKATNEKPKKGREKHTYRILSFVKPVTDDLIGSTTRLTANDFIIRSEEHGVPQKRHRVILLGIREDIIDGSNALLMLEKSERRVTIKSVIDDLPALRSGLSKLDNTPAVWRNTLEELGERLTPALNNSETNLVSSKIKEITRGIVVPADDQGRNFGLKRRNLNNVTPEHHSLNDWYSDTKMDKHITNHSTRGHIIGDLERYMFCSAWAQVAQKNGWANPFPKSPDYPQMLKPAHRNFDSGHFSDRFRVQVAHDAATTITSHISKDGHYYIHYDPAQCRSLTVREAARVQTFPDNYFFVGNRTQQYVQVGNAVPPFLAYQLANIVAKLLT